MMDMVRTLDKQNGVAYHCGQANPELWTVIIAAQSKDQLAPFGRRDLIFGVLLIIFYHIEKLKILAFTHCLYHSLRNTPSCVAQDGYPVNANSYATCRQSRL